MSAMAVSPIRRLRGRRKMAQCASKRMRILGVSSALTLLACGSEAPAPSITPTSAPSASSSTSLPSGLSSGQNLMFATAASTGVNETAGLRKVVGDYYVRTAGAIVEDLDIQGSLFIEAPDVTVRNVKVTCSSSWWIVKAVANRVTISDSTFTVDRSSGSYCQYGISAGEAAKIYRNEIAYTPNGLDFPVGNQAEVVGNWIHDQRAYPGKEDHVDAAQINGGGTGPYVFRNNHFSVPESQTSCLALFTDFGLIQNVTVDGNLFDGGGWSVYGGGDTATNVVFTNNRFSRSFYTSGGYYGPVAYFNSNGLGNVWSNNRWLDTGTEVRP
jgi:hypothetical protein